MCRRGACVNCSSDALAEWNTVIGGELAECFHQYLTFRGMQCNRIPGELSRHVLNIVHVSSARVYTAHHQNKTSPNPISNQMTIIRFLCPEMIELQSTVSRILTTVYLFISPFELLSSIKLSCNPFFFYRLCSD